MTPPKYLYHGTNARNLRAILRKGLRPRGARKSVWPEAPSRPEHVYLSVAYPIHFAKCATTAGTGQKAAVIRIDVDKLQTCRLYADEDALEQFNRAKDVKRWPTMQERTAFYRDSWQYVSAAKKWQDSIALLGNCSHHGPIPAEAISGVAIIEPGTALWYMSDPTITALNYRLLGPYYRALTAYPFEGITACQREIDEAAGQDMIGSHHLGNLIKLKPSVPTFLRPGATFAQIVSEAERPIERRKRA